MLATCQQCNNTFEAKGARGRSPKFCGATCRKRAQRQREAKMNKFHALAKGRWARCEHKRPIQIDGNPASTTNPNTWATYETVQVGHGDGYGVMLGNGLGCIDLDHCFNEYGLTQWAKDILTTTQNILFVERSLSGDGLHIFCELPERKGTSVKHDSGAVETFSRARFIRTTFNEYA